MDNDEVMEMGSGDEESGAMTRSKSRNRSQSHVRGPGRDKAGMKVRYQNEICILYKKCPYDKDIISCFDFLRKITSNFRLKIKIRLRNWPVVTRRS